MNTYFIADLHFSHENCLSFDNRPFKTIEEHDTELIRRWNETVGFDDDDVWILGDISWGNTTKTIEIFSQLNGNKHLCIGNHDRKLLKSKNIRDLFIEEEHEPSDIRPEFVWSTEPVKISIDAQGIIEDATEDLYEDAFYDIPSEKIIELQDYLNKWCKECGVGTTYFEGKYKVRIPWEDYDE